MPSPAGHPSGSASAPAQAADGSLAEGDDERWDTHLERVLGALEEVYRRTIEPVERRYKYDTLRPSWFSETIRQRTPLVTFLGSFSSGKSTFVNYLLQGECLLTGPQPVTDKFTVIMHGDHYQQIPGHVLLADATQLFRPLNQFGENFADHFGAVLHPHPILRSVSLIDTPGVLESAADTRSRRYNYAEVCRWFVERSDLVLVLFDPSKLDAGAELSALFQTALRGHEPKLRIVFNKADSVSPQELLRVYGALFWNLSSFIRSTEPPRVYVSSFWDRPYEEGTDHDLLAREKEDLLYELLSTVPKQSLDRRVTSVRRRATAVLSWAALCATYRAQMPRLFGKRRARKRFFETYASTAKDLAVQLHLSEVDFPSGDEMQNLLDRVDSSDFPDWDRFTRKGWLANLRKAIDVELPALQPILSHTAMDPREQRHQWMLQGLYHLQPWNPAGMRRERPSGAPLLPILGIPTSPPADDRPMEHWPGMHVPTGDIETP